MTIEYVLDYLKKQLESMKKDIEELEELIRLGELMGIDVTQHRAKLEMLKQKYARFEDGYAKYIASRTAKAK